MRVGVGLLLALCLVGRQADAAILRYELSGSYQDGQILSGGFSVDTSQPLSTDIGSGAVVDSTVTLSANGTYGVFGGGVIEARAGEELELEFLTGAEMTYGILDFTFRGEFDGSSGTIQRLESGPIPFGSIFAIGAPYGSAYSQGPYDMVLVSGTIREVPEPMSAALLGSAVAGVAATRRRR